MPNRAVEELVVPIAEAAKLEVAIDNIIQPVESTIFKGKVGLAVVAVNGNLVTNRSELRDELHHIVARDPNGTVKLSLSSAQDGKAGINLKAVLAQGDIPVEPPSPTDSKKDEFDMQSDSDKEDDAVTVPAARTGVDPARLLVSRHAPLKGTAENVIAEAAQTITPGKCIILLCDGFNPAVQVEAAATKFKANVMHVDPVARIKTRQRLDEFAQTLRKSLEKGVWIFIENATKSISLLEQLVECLATVVASGTLNPDTRILLMCEPHPHFPPSLMEGSIALRLKPTTQSDEVSAEDLSQSRVRMTLLKCHADNLGVTQMVAPQTAAAANGPPQKRRVKIATEVDVVKIETEAFMEMSASAIPPANDNEANEDGTTSGAGIERTGRYRFGPSEKMISLCRVTEDRYAVGTSSGYVVVLDKNGLPMIQYRPHKACIWDVAFASSYDFATASEDGTSSVFRYDLREQELEAASVASFQSDVFAVCYSSENDASSAVLSGGLSATVCILHSDRKSSSFVPATTSIQALCTIPARGHALIGGGNGVITTVDPDASKVVETSNKHLRKVPAVSACGSTLLTGSFDKTLRVWDYRAGMHCSHNLVMADVLTATALSDTHAAACSGSSLFLWDLRMLNQVLAVKNKAWNGLTRGLVLQGHTLVTASVDGNARFWKFS